MKLEKRKKKSFFNNNIPPNIRLVSSEDVLIKTNILALIIRLQDVLIKTNIFALVIHLQDVFETSLRCLPKRLQGIFKTFSRCLHDIFKTSCKDVFKTLSRRISSSCTVLDNMFSRCLQDVFTFVKRTAKLVICTEEYALVTLLRNYGQWSEAGLFFKKDMRNFAGICAGISVLVFSCEICETWNINLFAEQH